MLLFFLEYAMRKVSPLPGGKVPHLVSEKIGEYKLTGMIGKGNFGEVFLAEDAAGVCKALKIFQPQNEDRRSFDLEYDGLFLARRLKNEHLVPVEVKAGSAKAKSLRTMIDSEHYPDIKCGIKLTDGNVGFSNGILTLPQWSAFLLKRLLALT